MPTYNLTAVNVPAVQVAGTLLDPLLGQPTTRTAYVDKQKLYALDVNQLLARIDALGRYGAGIYAVAFGLDLSAGAGLSAHVSNGLAMLDGPIAIDVQPAGYDTHVLSDNTDNYVWLSRSGAFGHRTTADGVNMLLPPSNTEPWVYLGRMTTLAGAITATDYSGRLGYQGGLPIRRTNDAAKPGDTPGAALAFYTRTLKGLWLWDGAAYRLILDDGYIASANQADITLGNTDGEIGGLTFSNPPTQAECQALRDKCEELADDFRAAMTLIRALRTALISAGTIKGSA